MLYRLKQARELLAKTKADGLVVGEGYLDVIAFERAGIAAVAPCGTALTEEQLQAAANAAATASARTGALILLRAMAAIRAQPRSGTNGHSSSDPMGKCPQSP